MRKSNGRELKALLILSIVAPVGILISLRLTGILQEPITITETITLETIEWMFERPNQDVYIDDELNATYNSDEISVTFRVILGVYHNDELVYNGADIITIGMMINSTMTRHNGFVESVYVVSHKDSQPSLVDWIHTHFNLTNLSLVSVSSGWISEEDYKEAYVMLAGEDSPERIYFWAAAEWSLLTPDNQSHQMEVSFELIYYNGMAYKKVVQPFQLKILGR